MNKEAEKNKDTLDLLIKTGWAEGISFLVLLGIAMPMKYMMDMPMPVRIVGMIHGVLFILFAVMIIKATREYKWPLKFGVIAFLLSFLPFGTFFLHKVFKQNG
jgi:integral membrane protein